LGLDGDHVAGYVSLTTGSVQRDEAPTSDAVAARLLVVDAIDDDAAAFYRRWGFVDVPENPRRLHRKVSDVRRSLGDA
jgi:hypothetical protein